MLDLPEVEIILLGIKQDVDYFSNSGLDTTHRNRSGVLRALKVSAARRGWVRYEPSAWLGRSLTPTERKNWSTILKKMEAADLVECQRDDRGRVKKVSLTDAGTKAVDEM